MLFKYSQQDGNCCFYPLINNSCLNIFSLISLFSYSKAPRSKIKEALNASLNMCSHSVENVLINIQLKKLEGIYYLKINNFFSFFYLKFFWKVLVLPGFNPDTSHFVVSIRFHKANHFFLEVFVGNIFLNS